MRVFFLLMLALLFTAPAMAADAQKHYSISEFKSAFRPGGLYKIRAYVAQAFECPPCPPGAMCEPCSDFIVLSDKEPKRCDTSKFCDYEMALLANNANHTAEAKRAGKALYTTTIEVGGISLREMINVDAEESIERMMKKDPELREKNPIKWMQEHYELQDKSLQIKKP